MENKYQLINADTKVRSNIFNIKVWFVTFSIQFLFPIINISIIYVMQTTQKLILLKNHCELMKEMEETFVRS